MSEVVLISSLIGGGRAIDEVEDCDTSWTSHLTLASNCAPVTEIAVFYKGSSADTYFISAELLFIPLLIRQIDPDKYFWAGWRCLLQGSARTFFQRS